MEITRNQERLNRIGQRLAAQFDVHEKLRRDKEQEWAEDLRQYRGIYDPEVAALIPRKSSKVYPKYTRSKVRPCIAKLNNMLFPTNDRNWDIEPTPKPEIKNEAAKKFIEALTKDPSIDNDAINEAVMRIAKDMCDRMRTVMDDQMIEMGFIDIGKKVIESAVKYGTGIIKGPLTETRMEYMAERVGATGYRQNPMKRKIPYFEFVPIWSWYPDMSVTDYNMKVTSYELHVMDKHDLRALTKRKDFFGDIIFKYMMENPDGDMKVRQWMLDLQSIGDEVKDKTFYRRYALSEMWGYVDGTDLIAAGIEKASPNEEYYSNIWLLGNHVIKAAMEPTPGNMPMYHVFYLDKDETSIYGEGLPRSIRHSAISIAASARAMLDNAAKVAGPQLLANRDLMPDEDLDNVYPFKVWQREGTGQDAAYRALEAIHFESHIDEYISIIREFKTMGDEESTFPSFMFGESVAGSNETARGMSIKSSNVNVTIGDVVKNFDKCYESALKALYQWNMEFNPDPNIKGDGLIKAKGYTSLLSKEMRLQALDFFATTLTPEDHMLIDRRAFLAERMKLHDLDADKLLRTEEEVEAIQESMRDREAEALAKAKMESEIRYDHAKASHMESKAESEGLNRSIETVRTLQEARGEEVEQGEDLRMKQEEHAMKLAHKDDEHRLKMQHSQQQNQMKTMQTAQQNQIKLQQAEQNNQLKMKQSDAAHKQKIQQAKQKPKVSGTKK